MFVSTLKDLTRFLNCFFPEAIHSPDIGEPMTGFKQCTLQCLLRFTKFWKPREVKDRQESKKENTNQREAAEIVIAQVKKTNIT